jgi:hypothetical protein
VTDLILWCLVAGTSLDFQKCYFFSLEIEAPMIPFHSLVLFVTSVRDFDGWFARIHTGPGVIVAGKGPTAI